MEYNNFFCYYIGGISHGGTFMEAVLKTYDARLDSKKRITIRNPKYEYYHVVEQENGTVVLQPRELIDPLVISKKTLEMIDKSMKNVKDGVVYGPVKVK